MIKIVKPDGNSAETPVYFSTGVQTIYIKGLISTEINHVTIEYLGNKFSDPDDVYVGEGEFTFPNPNSFSEGIDLSTGLNVFKVSAFKDDISYGLLELNVIFSADVVGLVNPPSGIIVSRSSNSVEVSFDHLDSEVVYYNIYASALSGGVVSNYFKINHEPLSPNKYGSREEIVNALKETSTDISLEDEDPLFLETTSTQKDHSDVVLSSQTLNTFEVAETVKRIRISSTFQSIALKTRVAFRHVRNASLISTPPTISVGALSSVSSNKPLYYVVTSVKVIAGVEIESPLSVEVSGMPIQVTNTTLSLPVVGRDQMATDMIQSIFLSQPNIAIQAGSVVRDIIIDPFLSEMERVRFLLDFCYRSSSFSGLLSIDDPLNEGSSISVVESQYKTVLTQALFVQEDEVQVFIDSAFEKLASNFGVRRSIGKQATGEVSFFTTNAPSSSISIPAGTVLSSSTTNFITTLSVVLNVDQLSQYYNPTTKKYSIVVPVQARDAGVSGNLTSDQITKGSPFGLKVTNQAPTFGGTDTETNSELASRAISVLSSVDISTKAGLERVSREISGVINSFVVDSESPYMQRDDELGGKVDIWIRGESLATVSDVYAPSYQSYFESRFIPVSSPNAYIFRNMEATIETPLSEMINRGSLGYGLRNLTTNQTFDLTNVVILDYRTIQLDSSISQPTYSVADNIIGEWRSGITNKIILKRQPVREIKSVSYADGTAISDYSFYDNEDALQLGRSSGSSNYVLIPNNTERNKILIIEDESHTIIGFYPERLNNLGVDQLSLVVTDVAGTTLSTSTRIGYRWINDVDSWMYGVYAGYDTRELKAGPVDTTVTVTDPRTVHFQQVAVGAEAVSNQWSVHAYVLMPTGTTEKQLNSHYEGGALDTVGVDAGYQINDKTKATVGYYHQNGDVGEASGSGVSAGLSYDINQNLTAGVKVSYDDAFETRVMATINYTFGKLIKGDEEEKEATTNMVMNALSDSPEQRDVRVHDGYDGSCRVEYNGFIFVPVCI